ncbi:MAG: hypothetical protein K0R89_906 [Ramlibacter sp.]|jgi:hypothetical protein|nr:hypothetical protein [Ramlibacter sp.]
MKALWAFALAACAGAASAQAPCPRGWEIGQAEMLGSWSAEFEGGGPVGTLVLRKHEEYAGSLSGHLDRGGQRRQVAGDMDEGEFTLEDSVDGQRISGTWLGEAVDGSCGREVRGTWSVDGAGKDARSFVLRKQ